MRAAEIAEIQDNDLAQATMSLLDRIRPHLTTIVAAIAVVFVGLASWTMMASQRATEMEQAWDACAGALQQQSPDGLAAVAMRYPGSAAATWSQILLADRALADGDRIIFVDRALGRQRLQDAADAYARVLAERPPEMAAQRAAFGLAKARESMGELDAARQGYETLSRENPGSPLASLAASRAAALGRPAAKGWYDWFAENAKPAATPDATPPAGSPAAEPAADAG